MMTFVVNYAGGAFQKDLGLPSAVAENFAAFNPDPTWKKVDAALAD